MTGTRSIRYISDARILGWPLLAVARGPALYRGESRGHARGIIAVADVATGIIAVGRVATGILAIGGIAVGLAAIGGMAFGALALGGVAVGGGSTGGVAVGHFARGGAALGTHVVDPIHRDPTAEEFFDTWMPGLSQSTTKG